MFTAISRLLKKHHILPVYKDLTELYFLFYSDLDTTDAETDVDFDQKFTLDAEGNKIYNGIVTSRSQRKADKKRLYNFSKIKKNRKWLKVNFDGFFYID